MTRNRKRQNGETERAGEEIKAEQADAGDAVSDQRSEVIGGSDLGPEPGTGDATLGGREVF